MRSWLHRERPRALLMDESEMAGMLSLLHDDFAISQPQKFTPPDMYFINDHICHLANEGRLFDSPRSTLHSPLTRSADGSPPPLTLRTRQFINRRLKGSTKSPRRPFGLSSPMMGSKGGLRSPLQRSRAHSGRQVSIEEDADPAVNDLKCALEMVFVLF